MYKDVDNFCLGYIRVLIGCEEGRWFENVRGKDISGYEWDWSFKMEDKFKEYLEY